MTVRLKGSSWGHERGHQPMVAASEEYARENDVEIQWVPRTLTEFGVLDIGDLAAEYDLVVIDHPHVGGVAVSGSLVALDALIDAPAMSALAEGSPGHSHQSYNFNGHQWALAIDAACQVAAHRADFAEADVPSTWEHLVALAREGRVAWPVNPVDVQASFLTLAAASGMPLDGEGDVLISPDTGVAVFEKLHSVTQHLDPGLFDMNAIDVLEMMSSPEDNGALYCPFVFGYSNYSRAGFRERLLTFRDIIPLGADGTSPAGSLLGGVGLGVSARSSHIEEAAKFTHWIAGADVQRGVFARSGGQPAHRAAWDDPELDTLAGGFFSGVRRTTDESWTRPRVPGYVEWQNASLSIIHSALRAGAGFDSAVTELNRLAAGISGSARVTGAQR